MNNVIKTSMKNLFFCAAFLSTTATIAMEVPEDLQLPLGTTRYNLVVSAKNANTKYKKYGETSYSSLILTIQYGLSDVARQGDNYKTFILNPLACLKFVNDFLQNTEFQKQETVNHNWNTESVAALYTQIPQYTNLRNVFFTLCYFCKSEEPEVFAHYLENSFDPTSSRFNHAAINNMIQTRYNYKKNTAATVVHSCGSFLDTASRALSIDPQVSKGIGIEGSSNILNTVINQFRAAHRDSLPWYVYYSSIGYWYVKFLILCKAKMPWLFKTSVQNEQNYAGGMSQRQKQSGLMHYVMFPYRYFFASANDNISNQNNDYNPNHNYDGKKTSKKGRHHNKTTRDLLGNASKGKGTPNNLLGTSNDSDSDESENVITNPNGSPEQLSDSD